MNEKSQVSIKKREGYASRLGFILVLIGGSVGLGNIWRFPYMAGKMGGAAFLVIYLLVTLVFGIPLIALELSIGKKTGKSIVPALKELKPNSAWKYVGYFGVTCCCIVYAMYSVVSGWTLAYFTKSLTGEFMGLDIQSVGNQFGQFIGSGMEVVLWTIAILIISGVIVSLGIQKGVERVSKILLPLLLILMLVLLVRALTLPNAEKGISFYLKPDFSKINSKVILAAFGQAFFSLGIGLGATATLGSYADKSKDNSNIISNSTFIAIGDLFIAILAGFIVFPCVFAFGMNPGEGPGLVFVTLNSVFSNMQGGQIFGALFYLLLLFAIFTSTFTILQVLVGHFTDNNKWRKGKAVIVSSLIGLIVGIPYALGFGLLSHVNIFNMGIPDLIDYIITAATPIGALMLCIFAGWIWGAEKCAKSIGIKNLVALKIWSVLIKFIAPIIIIIVLVTGL